MPNQLISDLGLELGKDRKITYTKAPLYSQLCARSFTYMINSGEKYGWILQFGTMCIGVSQIRKMG